MTTNETSAHSKRAFSERPLAAGRQDAPRAATANSTRTENTLLAFAVAGVVAVAGINQLLSDKKPAVYEGPTTLPAVTAQAASAPAVDTKAIVSAKPAIAVRPLTEAELRKGLEGMNL